MSFDSEISRRRFVTNAGLLASSASLAGCASAANASTSPTTALAGSAPAASKDWDLSWIARVTAATDRAVFDWPSLGTPEDQIVLQIAARFLDNCASAYAPGTYNAVAVLNIRTTAIPAAMTDAAWQRYSLGAEYKLADAVTKADATRNAFWSHDPKAPNMGTPSIQELVNRGAIALVCDFAMGHLSTRLAAKTNRSADEVHHDLRSSLIPGAYAVPSGIFGLARSQNAGCAFVRM